MRRFNSHITWLLPFLAAVCLLSAATVCRGETVSPPSLRLKVLSGKEVVLFDHAKDACEDWDVPDTPTRAYRGANGLVYIFQSNDRNRRMIGKSLLNVKRECKVTFKGDENDDPSKFNDHGWIASTYTADGKTIYGVVHNEFHANERPQLCPSKDYMSCWYNALTMVVSTDGGDNFKLMKPHLLAAIPFRQAESVGHHAGFFEPSNIVKQGKYLYFMSHVVSPYKSTDGNCLFRAKSWQDKKGWQVWRDNVFAPQLKSPYKLKSDASKHACDPIESSHLRWPVTSLVQHEPSKTWIALMIGRLPKNHSAAEQKGIFYATSKNLMNWSESRLLLAAPINSSFDCKKDQPVAYPALVDDNSTSQNFDTTDDHFYLTYVQTKPKSCQLSSTRNLIAVPVEIAMPPTN